MPHIFIKDLKSGVEIKQFFVIQKLELRNTAKGAPFLNLLLSDRSGIIAAKVWSERLPSEEQGVASGIIAGVQGRVEQFQEELQINVSYIAGAEFLKEKGRSLNDLDIDNLLPRSPFDIEEMWTEIITVCHERIHGEPLRDLTLEVLARNEEAFKNAPAALQYHHAYRGGLLEHTRQVLRYVLTISDVEKELNSDVLIAGAILHDVGKIFEIEGSTAYTHSTAGRLIGHLILGRDLVRDTALEVGIDPKDLNLLHIEHVILSHHGALELGSPVVPKSPEALIVHVMDDLNAKIKMIQDHSEKHKKDSLFTEYHRVLKRSFLLPLAEADAD
ncbi:MAG: HD domain-containing protein [Deltaproteobacteria bacterium]|nr:HD domain-containing protein [Deltaproteobacteria bacterium]